MKKILLFVVFTFILSVSSSVFAEDTDVWGLDLSEKQKDRMSALAYDFFVKENVLENRLETIEDSIVENLLKEDRFESQTLNRIRASKLNMLLSNMGQIYSQLIKHRLEFLVKARNVLNEEQLDILADLLLEEPDEFLYFEDEAILGIDLTDPFWKVDLTIDQERTLLDHYARRDIKSTRLFLALEHQLLDIAELIKSKKRISRQMDEKIIEVGEIVSRIIDNEIDSFVVTKDVLTVEQKKELFVFLMLED